MADSAERMRRLRARKAREEDVLRRARENVLEPSRYVWDDKAGEYRTVTPAERERMLSDATARAERYALWRLDAFERGECAHPY